MGCGSQCERKSDGGVRGWGCTRHRPCLSLTAIPALSHPLSSHLPSHLPCAVLACLQALKDAKVAIFVRRGGPNYVKGLQLMRTLGETSGLPIKVGAGAGGGDMHVLLRV